MRRVAALLVLAIALVGGVLVVLVGGSKPRDDVLQLADDPVIPIAVMREGERFCQDPIRLPAAVSSVRLVVAPGNDVPRGPVEVTLRTPGPRGGSVLARARQPRELLKGETGFRFDRTVGGPRTVALCVQNGGPRRVQVWGDSITQGRPTLSTSEGYLDGEGVNGDLSARFPATEPRTVLERVPAALRAMAAFKLGGVGVWLPWTLLVLVALAVPLGLAWAVARVARDDGTGK